MEYAYKTAVYDIYKTQFKKMTIGTPLMYWMGQEGQRDDVGNSNASNWFSNAKIR